MASGKEAGTHLVVAQAVWREVLAAIGLDSEANGWAVEIEDIDADWVLTTELKTGQAAAAEQVPEHHVGVRGVAAQASTKVQRCTAHP